MEISKHAYNRAKQRMGLNKKGFTSFCNKAIKANVHLGQTYGRLRKYLYAQILAYKYKAKVLLQDDYILVINEQTIVTVYKAPNNLQPTSQFIQEVVA